MLITCGLRAQTKQRMFSLDILYNKPTFPAHSSSSSSLWRYEVRTDYQTHLGSLKWLLHRHGGLRGCTLARMPVCMSLLIRPPIYPARTCNRHAALQLARLASAVISWLWGIRKSPCWRTSHAVVHLGVRLSVYFWALVCVPHSAQTLLQTWCNSPRHNLQAHSAHKQLCPAKQRQKKRLRHTPKEADNPSHMPDIRLLVSAPSPRSVDLGDK